MATAKTTKKKATKKKVDAETDEAPEKKTAVKAKPKKKAAKRKAKVVEPVRAKLYWGVFNQSSKRVAVFDFSDKKSAEKHAKTLSKTGTEHFLQRIKEAIE
jgi:hypothetical protein